MSRGQFYLDKQNAKIWGVCAGIADYTGIDAFWVRLAAVLVTLMGSGVPILAYIIIAWLANAKPAGYYGDSYDRGHEERELRRMERRRAKAPGATGRTRRIGADLDDFDRRVRDLEAHYATSNRSSLAAEIDSLR